MSERTQVHATAGSIATQPRSIGASVESPSVSTPAGPGIFEPPYRAATIGIVGLVSVVAFEAMGSATVMPTAAASLDGLFLYGFLFGGPLAVSLLGMVLAGRWSDQQGPMRPVWIGAGLFLAGLLVAALSGSVWWLLLGRVMTGLGSGMAGVALYALVGRVYPASLHSKIFAAFAAAWVLPALIGPGAAGWITQLHGWRYGIATAAILALPVCLLLTRVPLVQASPSVRARAGAPASRVLWALGAAVAAIMLHLLGQAGPEASGASSPSIAAMLAVAAALWLLLRSARELLPAGTLAARRGLPAAIALSGLSQAAFFAAEAFLPLLLHREKEASAGVAGLVLSAGAVSWSIGAFCRARIHQRISVGRLLRSGFVLLGSGIALSALVLVPAAPVVIAMLGWTLAGAGMGLVSPTLSVVTLALAQPSAHGQAGASLRLSAALATTAALALSGATFALLLGVHPAGAFVASLGLAVMLAVTGVFLAGRVDHPGPEG